MSDFELEKSIWDSEGYYYLSKEDSDLYDSLRDSDDPKDKKIVEMLLDKAKASRAAHKGELR
jgi:hypothetical protein